jgi:hypothetical protein
MRKYRITNIRMMGSMLIRESPPEAGAAAWAYAVPIMESPAESIETTGIYGIPETRNFSIWGLRFPARL